jgi:adenosylcobinamide-GDP ribazoletransferase
MPPHAQRRDGALAMRGFIIAVQFLTRLPTPPLANFHSEELAESALWFPVVGFIIGALVATALAVGTTVDPWLGALAALVTGVLITGALHLDGLADLSDALGAAHRSSERFVVVLRDPHVGTYGVVAIVLVCAAKLILFMLAAKLAVSLIALTLTAAWARYGAVIWSQILPPLTPGTAAQFAQRNEPMPLVVWAAGLVAASLWFAPVLVFAAPIALAGWWLFLRLRLGAMSGDGLGAGIELVEIVVLVALVSAA